MYNRVILIGRLGKDPEAVPTQGGTSLCRFSLATDRKYKGESQTQWHSCTAFGKLAEICVQYLKKGSLIAVEGRIEYRQWEDQQGQTRYATNILLDQMKMLGGRDESHASPSQHAADPQQDSLDGLKSDPPFDGPVDSDIPFAWIITAGAGSLAWKVLSAVSSVV